MKVEETSFNLKGKSLKSVNLAQSYVHLKIAKNEQKLWNYVESGKSLIFYHFLRFSNALCAKLTDFNDSSFKLKLFSSTLIAFLGNISWLH